MRASETYSMIVIAVTEDMHEVMHKRRAYMMLVIKVGALLRTNVTSQKEGHDSLTRRGTKR